MVAKFLKFCETNDNGWLNWRFGKCGEVGNAFVLLLLFDLSYVLGFVDSFVFYSLICTSKRILFFDDENIPKNLQIICVLRLLVGLLVYVLRMC